MKMRKNLLLLLLSCCIAVPLQGQRSCLQKQGTATQLRVDGKAFLVLGGELGNSSASSAADIERIFPRLQQMGLNTVLVPAYWELTEPVEGHYDFTLTDKIVRQARQNQLKVIFLWFGVWKNSMSCYAPLWLKKNYRKYPRASTQSGKPLEIASVFSPNVFQAEHRAFSRWMEHLAAIDKDEGTVIMIQLENETGMLEDARDYSSEANTRFNAPVPPAFLNYLQKEKKNLHPRMYRKWESQGFRLQGNWSEVFGADLYTDELFMAWHYACYVEGLAQTAHAIHPIPLFVNAALDSRNRKPGQYPSAGPLAHLIDVWQSGAPHLDFLAPDLYDTGFKDWVAQYKRHNNPLFIPEMKRMENNGVRAFYVFGEHDAIGISPFAIEEQADTPSSSLVQSYARLKELMPLLTRWQGKGQLKGLLLDEAQKERTLYPDDLKITCRHSFTLPWDARATNGSVWPEGGGLLLRMAPDEYLVAGSGIVLEFEKAGPHKAAPPQALGEDGFLLQGQASPKAEQWNNGSRIGIGSIDEVQVDEEGSLHCIRRLNGDQSHQGRHVHIPLGQFSILHVKLYEYQ